MPGPRAHIHDMIGAPDGILVVLDNHQRVPEIPQPPERVDQFLVVFLVEAYRRLVEHVQDSHQVRPDLGREPDPLRLPSRKGSGVPGEGQVGEPDLLKEIQPGVDLF